MMLMPHRAPGPPPAPVSRAQRDDVGFLAVLSQLFLIKLHKKTVSITQAQATAVISIVLTGRLIALKVVKQSPDVLRSVRNQFCNLSSPLSGHVVIHQGLSILTLSFTVPEQLFPQSDCEKVWHQQKLPTKLSAILGTDSSAPQPRPVPKSTKSHLRGDIELPGSHLPSKASRKPSFKDVPTQAKL